MNNHTTIGVDLAKNVIAVARLSKSGKLSHSKELSRRKFRDYLATQKASLVAFEACATAHYWSRVARSFGHDTKILPALSVAPFRQGHKTDVNDALAVAEAANRPNLKEAPYKTIDQQTVQAIQRSRDLLVSESKPCWHQQACGKQEAQVDLDSGRQSVHPSSKDWQLNKRSMASCVN